ncbi:diguanylate cyclase [uncultured Thiomicrorhabdus sp.]
MIAQEAKLQGITDTSQDAIVQIDAHGRTSFWNPAAERLFGYSASEALGQDLHKLIVPKRYLNQFEAGFAKFAQDGIVNIVGEIINAHAQHKDGHEFNIALSLSTLHQDGQWHAVGIIRDTTKQKQYEADLEQLAHYDPMTGLANRSSLLHYLTEKLHQKQGCDCAIFFLNIDHFRHINDSFGHDTGNAVLQEIAKRLQDNFAQLGFISHLGGDEFILVTESVQEKSDLEHLAQEMNDVLTKPYEVLEQSILHLSTSIGIVTPLQQVESAKHYLQFADIALYRAKQAGRNTYRFYHAKYVNEVNEHVRYHNALHQALDRNEFELHYQPQSYLNNDRIIGAEALLRWKHPVEGYIPPDKFIPIAEESEVISDIGAWVIDEACRQGKRWQDQGYDLHVSVNVSLQQLRHQNVAQIVKNALKVSGFQAERLVVEITESVLSVDKQLLANMLHAIKAQGVSIAIDDFGTGYSSYGYMKYFPIDILKIDKIFMDNVPYEKDDAAIVVAILAMSNVLQYKVVAEGVENQDQIDFLRQQGCHYYQGFYKSPAKKAPEFQALLDKYGTSPNGFKHRKNAS